MSRSGSAGLLILALLASPAHALNPTQVENANPGTTAWQITNPATSNEIEGYASLTSVNLGGQISLFVNCSGPKFNMDVYRIGWYGGAGGRLMFSVNSQKAVAQKIPSPDVNGMIECQWVNPIVLNIPANWCSGIYLAKLTISPSPKGKQNYIIFVVRDDGRPSYYNYQSPVCTYQAYNSWGGKSLYDNQSLGGRAYKVSFNRPYQSSTGNEPQGAGEFLDWEINMVRFLEREGYDVTYSTSIDTHQNTNNLLSRASHTAFLSVGHDEYWSYQMRGKVEAARDSGMHLGFFGGNPVYWQVRFEPSPVTGQPLRTMVCYHDFSSNLDPYATDGDPSNDYLVTTLWRSYPVNRPEEALVGVQYVDWAVNGDLVIFDATHWVCTGTGLKNGDHLVGLLGDEVDTHYCYCSPSPTSTIAASPFQGATSSGTAYMTTYVAPSGAVVFGAGTHQWSWGLDSYNHNLADARAQQMMRNILTQFAH